MSGQIGVVLVVARVRTKLRRARVEIAYLQLQADHEPDRCHGEADDDAQAGPATLGEQIEKTPEAMTTLAGPFAVFALEAQLRRFRRNAHIGEQHRQQNQIGENQHRDADTGNHGQILNDLDLDQHQHGEPDGVAQQGGQPGQKQAPEGEARGYDPVHAPADVLHDAVHFLRAVAHANGEHQKRHQHRIRVQLVVKQRQQTQLPNHRHQRTEDHQQGAAQAARVPEQHGGGDQNRDGEKQQNLLQAGNQVTDLFREPGDADLDLVILVSAAQRLQLLGQRRIIQRLAVGRGGQQRDVNDAGCLVQRDQLTELVRPLDVAAQRLQICRGAAVVVGNHRAAVEALFGHGDPASGRCPQGLHVSAIDTG
ncbi:hypothetical protein PS645_03833 [Pseudomonas fluorescens]|uniref:Uncharacterized protein n=1 Tax=Pseudomonas fluorescens TaxID=294 RepID=A0A5E6VHQ2_PSEFL|nr:hypothetical protein PS645_03833 [Pseudomonas fluorescens]